jgi:NADPH-dependent glutamate synthase beta subunit-like oxidoreductase
MAFSARIPTTSTFRELVKCQNACPVGTDARGYIRAIAEGDFEKAYLIARAPNPLASICGRVCGAPCEAACRRGVLDEALSIRALKRFVTERFGVESGKFQPLEILRRSFASEQNHDCQGEEELASLLSGLPAALERGSLPQDAKRVAVIGGGPAGLACAHDLALFGVQPVVFESEAEPAGMLIYGVPEYRLPRNLIRGEVEVIRALGVEFRCNTKVGVDIGFDEILADFDSVVICVGAKNSRMIPLPGLDGPGVMGGVEFLRQIALTERPENLGHRVVVVGGGNVAYDVARTVARQVGIDVSRTALRQAGVASVTLASLESLEEMPADDIEILEGDEEGVERINSVGPIAIERDSKGVIQAILFQHCKRVFDSEGRFSPEFDESNQTRIPCDTVILSIGQSMDLTFIDAARDGIEMSERGLIVNDPVSRVTSHPDVFVAGDVAYGTRLLIDAVASGKQVARAVHQHLLGKNLAPDVADQHQEIAPYSREKDYEKIHRAPIPTIAPELRMESQSTIVELGFTEETARQEASRCFDCGVNPIFEGDKCVLCGGCVDVCPEMCLMIVPLADLEQTEEVQALRSAHAEEEAQTSVIIKDEELCIRCGLCAERCPNDAITMERFCFTGIPA